jgi:hypothetical protein
MTNPSIPSGAGLARREFLSRATLGVGTVALAGLLERDRLLAEPIKPDLEKHQYDLKPKPPHREPRARSMISLYMQGGPSHVDLLDPKPILTRLDGLQFPGDIKYDNAAQASSKVLGSFWKFKRHGQSGADVSELLPHLAGVVDDIAIVRSMHTGVNNHGQSIDALNGGRPVSGRPSLGSWLTYGLGSESQNLPAFVVLADRAPPVLGSKNWSNGWLPSLYQGTVVRQREPRILNLEAPPEIRGAIQERTLGLLSQLNRRHLEARPGELDLEARIASYELAARMQTAAKEALDLSGETAATLAMYGIDKEPTRDYGQRCLIARRPIERGVRFVQIFTTTQAWDHHGAIIRLLPDACQRTDMPAAALVRDLKQRGLLDSTVVHWGGEMGRLPVIQNDAGRDNVGRDHNTYGFTSWFAGGGFKAGCIHGATDEFGHRAVENIVTHSDFHATLLHLFGLDHERLTYKRNGAEQSLVDKQPCRVVRELLSA